MTKICHTSEEGKRGDVACFKKIHIYKENVFTAATKSIVTEYYLCNLRKRKSTCASPDSCGEGDLTLTLNIRESNCTYKSFLFDCVCGTSLWKSHSVISQPYQAYYRHHFRGSEIQYIISIVL